MTEDNQFITIVSGLPRSGTSLMMQMLVEGGIPALNDGIRQHDIDNPAGYYEFERVKELPKGNVAWLDEAKGKVVKVISALLTYLPSQYNYKVIFMRRHLAEVLESQRKMLVRRGEDPNKIDDAQMTEIFQRHLQNVESWLAKQPNVEVLYIHYHELLQEPTLPVQTINQFLGNRLETSAMLQRIDQTLYRNRVAAG